MYPIPRDWLSDKRVAFWGVIGVASLLDLGTWSVRGASRARLMDLQACGNMLRPLHGTCPPGGVSVEVLQDAYSDAMYSNIWFWVFAVATVLGVIVWEVWYRNSWYNKLYRLCCAARDLLALRSETGFDKSYRELVDQYFSNEE